MHNHLDALGVFPAGSSTRLGRTAQDAPCPIRSGDIELSFASGFVLIFPYIEGKALYDIALRLGREFQLRRRRVVQWRT
jgi:hypothetical protein